jgi:hypothetical protein
LLKVGDVLGNPGNHTAFSGANAYTNLVRDLSGDAAADYVAATVFGDITNDYNTTIVTADGNFHVLKDQQDFASADFAPGSDESLAQAIVRVGGGGLIGLGKGTARVQSAIENSHPFVGLAVKGLEIASAPVSFAISLTPLQNYINRGEQFLIDGIAKGLAATGVNLPFKKEDLPFLLGGAAVVVGIATNLGKIKTAIGKAADVIRDAPATFRRFLRDGRGSVNIGKQRPIRLGPTFRRARDPDLQAFNNSFFGKIDPNNSRGRRIGNGGLGDAIRHELRNGETTHLTKGFEQRRRLKAWLRRAEGPNPNSTGRIVIAADVEYAKRLLQDLNDALPE